MPDSIDPIAIVLRFVGAFYVFAGFVAARAGLMSAFMDTAIAGISAKPVSLRERALSFWLIASSWLVFAGGVLLMVLAREAMWAFIVCALMQGFYLTIAAPYYFDLEDPPDPRGRRQTTNAFFIYLGATFLTIWASGRHLTPLADLHPFIAGFAWAALAGVAGYMMWQAVSVTRLTESKPFLPSDAAPEDDGPELPKSFDPRILRVELSRGGGASPLRNQKTGAEIPLSAVAISNSLKANLLDWLRDGDPDMAGLAYNLSEQLSHECPEIAVAEPGIPNSYFGYALWSPYADPETGAPNWDRLTAIKIMCDYDCYPCWAADPGVSGCVPPSVLSISSALEDALLDWQARFDASLNRNDPADQIWTAEQAQAHEREGFDLAQRVKAERPEMTVYVHSARGVLIVDAAAPQDLWRIQSA